MPIEVTERMRADGYVVGDTRYATRYDLGEAGRLADYREACRVADGAVAQLGPGWRPRVWENLGWHAGARFDAPAGTVSVSCRREGRVGRTATTYHAMLCAPGHVGGEITFYDGGAEHATPREAVDTAIAHANGVLVGLVRRVEAWRTAATWPAPAISDGRDLMTGAPGALPDPGRGG